MYLKATFLALAAVVLLGLLNAWLGLREERFFTAALSQAGIPTQNLKLGDKERTYAKVLAEQNPLVALAGTDPGALGKNADELTDLEQQLYEVNASSSDAKLVYNLYPTNFLSALANLEQARQNFIASGSATDEASYNAAAGQAFSAYEHDAQAFAKAFAKAVPTDSGKFATDGDIISRDGILAAIQTLLLEMRSTKDIFEARLHCTRGDILECHPNDLQIPTLGVTPEVAVTPAQLAQGQAVRALSAEAHGQPAIAKGPMLLLPSTECVAHIDGAALFTFYAPASLGVIRAPFPLYIGNIRFNTTSASTSPGFERFSAAMKQQISYLLDSPMLHYSCMELAHDSGKLFAMQDIYTFAQSAALSTFAASSTAKEALVALENKNVSVVTEHEIESYLNAANTLHLSAQLQGKVRELTLGYIYNSTHFDRNIGEILADEESNVALVKEGWPINLEVPYTFFIRNSFAMLFLGGDQKLFPPNTIPKSQQPFTYYSELPHTPVILQKLIHDIHFFYIIHVDPTIVLGLITK